MSCKSPGKGGERKGKKQTPPFSESGKRKGGVCKGGWTVQGGDER